MTLNPQCLSFLWYVFQLASTLGLFRDCYVICLDYFPEKQITYHNSRKDRACMPVEIYTEKYDSEIPTRDASSHFKNIT